MRVITRGLSPLVAMTAIVVALSLALVPTALTARQATPDTPTTVQEPGVPMVRGNAAHTGEMPGPGPVADPEILWQFETGGVRTSPAVVGDTVYVGTLDGFVVALDRDAGTERWRFEVGGYASSPAVADGIVIVGGGGGRLYALDATNGAEIWSAATSDPSLFSDATIVGGVVHIGGYDTFVYAIDVATGDLIWEFQTGGRVWIAPAVAEGTVFARSDDGNLYALDATSGQERWSVAIGWHNESSSPAVVDGTVVVGGAEGITYAFDTATGEERWQVALTGIVDTSPAIVDGVVYIGATEPQAAGALHALDASTGSELWRADVPAGVASSASIADGVAWFGDWDGVLHAVDTTTGEERWSLPLDDGYAASAPAVLDGVVYVGAIGTERSHLFAIGGTPSE